MELFSLLYWVQDHEKAKFDQLSPIPFDSQLIQANELEMSGDYKDVFARALSDATWTVFGDRSEI